jgi:hypothetical protein
LLRSSAHGCFDTKTFTCLDIATDSQVLCVTRNTSAGFRARMDGRPPQLAAAFLPDRKCAPFRRAREAARLCADLFIQDLRQRVIGAPEISTDGFLPYQNAIRGAFKRDPRCREPRRA